MSFDQCYYLIFGENWKKNYKKKVLISLSNREILYPKYNKKDIIHVIISIFF